MIFRALSRNTEHQTANKINLFIGFQSIKLFVLIQNNEQDGRCMGCLLYRIASFLSLMEIKTFHYCPYS